MTSWKELLKELNLTIKDFAELYEIPYNTVRQWYNGTRQAPPYIKKMIEKIIDLKKNGTQLELTKNIKYDVLEKNIGGRISMEIYEENSYLFRADKNFWENEEKKGGKYPPKVRTFKVIELI